MTGSDLRSYVSRSQALLEAAGPTTARETRTLLVDPFLEALGWDVHARNCRTNVTVDGCHLEYALSIDSIPAMLVAVECLEDTLSESRAADLLEAMAWTGVDRAIYTNGRHFLFLAGSMDIDRLACQRTSLPEYDTSLEHFTQAALETHLEHHEREFVARRLALEREPLADAIVTALQDHAGESGTYDSEFEAATERFLDKLVVSFARGEPDRSAEPADVALEFTDATADEYTTAIEPADSSPADAEYRSPARTDDSSAADGEDSTAESSPSRAADSGAETHSSTDESTATKDDVDDAVEPADAVDDVVEPTDTDDAIETDERAVDRQTTSTAAAEPDAGDGEYVVRFFNERGSIGAIGHSSSAAALVHAAEYLFERGLSGVRVPWRPDDGDRTVLNDDPVRADGSSMDSPRELSNGLYLEAGGDVDVHQERVEALASRAGLRAMLTGDWEDADRRS